MLKQKYLFIVVVKSARELLKLKVGKQVLSSAAQKIEIVQKEERKQLSSKLLYLFVVMMHHQFRLKFVLLPAHILLFWSQSQKKCLHCPYFWAFSSWISRDPWKYSLEVRPCFLEFLSTHKRSKNHHNRTQQHKNPKNSTLTKKAKINTKVKEKLERNNEKKQ